MRPPERVDIDRGPLEVSFTPASPGREDDPVLVFLHEGLGSRELWRTFPDRVRHAVGGPSLLVFSRHGYGRSAPAEMPRPVGYMHHEADDVLPGLLTRYGIDAPILVGHSDGASIALLYAGAGRSAAGVVAIAPHVFVEDVTVESINGARDAYRNTDLRDRMAKYHDDVDAAFRGWNDVWLSPPFRSWNIEERLPSIECPVLLVQGDADPYGTLAQLDAIESGVRGRVQRLVVGGAGHSPHLDAPDETLSAVTRFVVSLGDQ
jgi:pimeloyl-ACP methyl ester carboxylesterase